VTPTEYARLITLSPSDCVTSATVMSWYDLTMRLFMEEPSRIESCREYISKPSPAICRACEAVADKPRERQERRRRVANKGKRPRFDSEPVIPRPNDVLVKLCA
jgi:hypothetical protein